MILSRLTNRWKRQVDSCPSIGTSGSRIRKSSSQQSNWLGTVYHETFQGHIQHTIFMHHSIEISHKITWACASSRCILQQAILWVPIHVIIEMTCQCSLVTKTLYMVKYDPWILHVAPKLTFPRRSTNIFKTNICFLSIAPETYCHGQTWTRGGPSMPWYCLLYPFYYKLTV